MLKFPAKFLNLGLRAADLARRAGARVVREDSTALLARAVARWPVLTGTSRRLLSVEHGGGTGRHARAVLRGRAGYTLRIRSKGIDPWDSLVLQPGWGTVRRWPRAIARAISAGLRSG